MKIVHRIGLNICEEVELALHSLGIEFKRPSSTLSLICFDIYESDPVWPKLQPLLVKWEAFDGAGAEFSKEEIETAGFLDVSPGEKGYPYPRPGSFGFLKATYDLAEYCEKCGSGKRQAAPFQMKGEPKWGKSRIFTLNWVFDQFFVPPAVWDEVFRPLGIGQLPVLHYKTREELQTVVQLEITRTADSPLATAERDYPFELCEVCGRKKFDPNPRGFFPRFVSDPPYDICRTQECFGSGGRAFNAIIISHKIYAAMRDHKVGPVGFRPLAPTVE